MKKNRSATRYQVYLVKTSDILDTLAWSTLVKVLAGLSFFQFLTLALPKKKVDPSTVTSFSKKNGARNSLVVRSNPRLSQSNPIPHGQQTIFSHSKYMIINIIWSGDDQHLLI